MAARVEDSSHQSRQAYHQRPTVCTQFQWMPVYSLRRSRSTQRLWDGGTQPEVSAQHPRHRLGVR